MLAVEQVGKKYGKKQVLSDISLDIQEGVCFGLVGPNGAGKSTLLKIIASIIRDHSGDIHFSKKGMRIGYVPQEIALEETLSARDNLKFFGKLYGLTGKKLNERMGKVLTQIGLASRAKDKVATFSGGMKRRLNIGCALLHEPNLIIMDEPTVGIDSQSRKYIFQMIDQLKQEGCTILYASHYMEEIEELCDAAAFIDHGKIVEKGELAEILNKHAAPAVFVKGESSLPSVVEGNCFETQGGYVINTRNPLETMTEIITYCKNRGYLPDRLELVKPRLEDVFFTLTGKQLRD